MRRLLWLIGSGCIVGWLLRCAYQAGERRELARHDPDIEAQRILRALADLTGQHVPYRPDNSETVVMMYGADGS